MSIAGGQTWLAKCPLWKVQLAALKKLGFRRLERTARASDGAPGVGEFAGKQMHAGHSASHNFFLDERTFNAIKMKSLRGQVLRCTALINTWLHSYLDNPKRQRIRKLIITRMLR